MTGLSKAGFRFRETRRGTPNELLALSRRGYGGIRLSTGRGTSAMMSKADAALSVSKRALLIAQRNSSSIEIPEMFHVSKRLGIIKGEVTIDLFEKVMEGYIFEGHNADRLRRLFDYSSSYKTTKPMTYVSLNDAREFARRLSELTNRKFRVPTESEWMSAGNRLSGNLSTWTETYAPGGHYIERSLGSVVQYSSDPNNRSEFTGFRLVEDT